MKRIHFVSTFWRTETRTRAGESWRSESNPKLSRKAMYVCVCNLSEGFIETDSKNMISQKGVFG